MTIVPLKLYFNEQGRAKIEIALARGKQAHDKRETEKTARLEPREKPAVEAGRLRLRAPRRRQELSRRRR